MKIMALQNLCFLKKQDFVTSYASSMNVDMNIQYVIRNGENLDNCETIYKTFQTSTSENYQLC